LEPPNPLIYRTLTVAAVRCAPGADHVEVLCLPSARIFRLERARPDFTQLLDRLQTAATTGHPVRIGFDAEHDDTIKDVQP
jgi:hypothetical protein